MLVLAALLAFWSGITLAYGDDSANTESEEAALSAPPSDPSGPELEAKRTATSQTFLRPDGGRETRIFLDPINYRDEGGEWQPIETKLHEVGDGAIVNGENSFDLRLPETMGEGAVRIAEDDQWVSYRLLGESAELGDSSGAKATYQSPDGRTSFELTSLPRGVKEEIVIADPSQSSSFAFELKASDGLTPILAEDGSLRFMDAEGDLFAQLPAPTIADAGGEDGAEGAVSYSLDSSGEGRPWRLLVAADKDWLSDPSRAWPVTIDPTTVKTGAEDDCTIGSLPAPEGWKACGDDGQTTLSASFDPKTGESARTFLRFVTKSVPKESFIKEATLSLYSPKAAENTAGLEIRPVTKGWNKDLTWKKYTAGSKFWTTPGGDFGPEVTAQILTTEKAASEATWWNFNSPALAQLVKKWREPGINQNLGIAVKQIDESKAACEANPSNCAKRSVSFNSSASTPTEKRPVLSVVYFPAAPASSKLTSPTEGTSTARRLKLESAWTAAGVTGITYQFREGKKGYFEDIPVSLVRKSDGQTVTKWPYAVSGVQQSPPLYFDAAHASPTLRKKGGSVQVRAVFHALGEGGEGYSRSVEAKVNRFLGGARDARADVGPGTLDLLTGSLALSRTDVSLAGFSTLAFSRTHNSRDAGKLGDTGVLGQGWKPTAPVEAAGGSNWRSVRLESFTEEVEEGVSETFAYAILTHREGYELGFEKVGENYESPDEAPGLKLTTEGSTKFALGNPGGSKTVFENSSGGTEFLPVSVTQMGSTEDNTTKMVYGFPSPDKRRLKMLIAASRTNCGEANATTTVGCRALTFTYTNAKKWGAPEAYGDRLEKITYHAPGLGGPWDVAEYAYDPSGRLAEAWDPRISPTPLREKYTYESGGQLKTITPPGLKSWTMEYGAIDEEEANGRLVAVKRDSLLESNPVAKTTIAYEVPIGGGVEGLVNMSSAQVGRWGQGQTPVDATAIFPPDQVPASSPPSSYARATVYYLDAQGEAVNVASPAGAGTEAASVSTTETDQFGNVVRELTPQNRQRALAKGTESEEKAESIKLDTHRQFSADGIELREEWGPLHAVRLSNGTTTEARLHKTVEYDKEAPTPPAGLPMPHLPTRETTGASIPEVGEDKDQQVSEYRYNWKLRKPTETIIDPKGLNIRSVTVYDEVTGLPVEVRQPSDVGAAAAATTRFIYWNRSVPGQPLDPQCQKPGPENIYESLPCKVLPATQPGGSLPKLKVKKFLAYNALGQATEVSESPGGEGLARKTVTTFDSAGRRLTTKIENGGTAVPKMKSEYDSATGLPVAQRFVCEESCGGFDDQAVTSTYDALGRVTKYQDADGSTSETTFDLLGRPVTTKDGKGAQTRSYDPTSGLLTKLEDSAAGTFTASYDANGQLVAEELPNGLVAKSTYDETDARTNLTYDKAGSIWLDFGAERSIYGQILAQDSTLSRQQYSYDNAGRLIQAKDWNAPTGGSCTTREYKFEGNEGKNSNRTKLITRAPGIGSACAEAGGATQGFSYDTADRLTGEGIAYDDFNRITSLPAPYAGGKAVTTSYFSTDMVASQTQNGVTNTFQLDASGRQRQRLQGGGLEGTEIFHYAGGSDAPAWTIRGSAWSRNIIGIGGNLAGIQDSASGTALQLTNLHGDVVGTASLSQSATKPTATFEYDEFGNPKQGGSTRFGWLGGKQRRTEVASGVIQMGVRSYVPTIGRFISTDPVSGGSANAYDYVNGDPVNSFDLTGEAPGGCGLKLNLRSRKHRIYSRVRYVCDKGAWPGPHALLKVQFKFERHTKGFWDELIKGQFEQKGGYEWKPSNPYDEKWRTWGSNENYYCGEIGQTYQLVYTLNVKLMSPVNGIVAGHDETFQIKDQVTCRR